MFTEDEIEWLRRGESLCERCGKKQTCGFPKAGNIVKCSCCWFEEKASGNDDYRDAAEFEARVQKWLMYQYEKVFQCKDVSGGFMPSRETMLMFARLAAEAEMEA